MWQPVSAESWARQLPAPEAFALTFVSEIGDKTFFIAAILAAGSSAADGLSQKAQGDVLKPLPL